MRRSATTLLGVLMLSASPATAHIPYIDDGILSLTRVVLNGDPVSDGDPLTKSVVGLEFTVGQEHRICTGFLVDANHVVTAAHCAVGTPKSYSIVFGRTLGSGSRLRIAGAPVMHPDYKGHTQGDEADIAVMKLAGQAPAGYVPAQIHTMGVGNDQVATIVGYGLSSPDDLESHGRLRNGTLMLTEISRSGVAIDARQHNNQGACRGDSGGPAFVDGEVAGILSLVHKTYVPGEKKCGNAQLTLLPYFKPWIEQVIGHKLVSRQVEAAALPVTGKKIAAAEQHGWQTSCRNGTNGRFCTARRTQKDRETYFGFFLSKKGLAIRLVSPTVIYYVGGSVIAIDAQKIPVTVTNVVCTDKACVHDLSPTQPTQDVVRALKAGSKIKFYAVSPSDFSLAGSAAALEALFEAAKQASISVP